MVGLPCRGRVENSLTYGMKTVEKVIDWGKITRCGNPEKETFDPEGWVEVQEVGWGPQKRHLWRPAAGNLPLSVLNMFPSWENRYQREREESSHDPWVSC